MSGVSKCRFCGAFAQEQDRFCWSCGSPLRLEAEPSQSRPTHVTDLDLDPDLQLILRRVFLAQRRGDLAAAERLAREVLARDPESVPGLTILSEILRGKGDLVGAVEAAQRATDAAARRPAPPGSLRRAREERARIEKTVLDGVTRSEPPGAANPLSLFTASGAAWHRSGRFNLFLAAAGLLGLCLALYSVFRGGALGYIWFAVSLAAAGWCYHDAESRGEPGLFWGPFALCLGPFGLAIYLLTRN